MSFDVDRAKREGVLFCKVKYTVLAVDGDLTWIRGPEGNHYTVHIDRLDNLPAEPDVMRLFDEAVQSANGRGSAVRLKPSEIREQLKALLHRDPVQRLDAEHGIVVFKRCGVWYGMTRESDGDNTVWRKRNGQAYTLLLQHLKYSDEGWPTPRACATAILAVLEGGE